MFPPAGSWTPPILLNRAERHQLRPLVDVPLQFGETIAAVQSNFFTLDVARRKDSGWVVVELGDGVVGLPELADMKAFFAALVCESSRSP